MGGYEIIRVGKVGGRWPSYRLVVDGVDIGGVKRSFAAGSDRLAPAKYDGWAIHGMVCSSKDGAEKVLIERAVRFGIISEK